MGYRNDIPDEVWDKLRMEYISSSDVSIRGLEKKHGISYTMIRTRMQNEKWLEQREELKKRAKERSIELVSEHQAEECSRAFRLANKVIDKLEVLIDSVVVSTEDEDKTSDVIASATRNLKNITSAIKDLKEIGVCRSELDLAEQKARIAKLRKEAEDEQTDTTITVRFAEDEYGN